MKTKYSIDQNTKTLVFTGKPSSLDENIIENKDKARITSVVIPNSVFTISNTAFFACSALVSVHIPNSVSIIEGETFRYCRSLASIHIPNSVEIIDCGAFGSCTALSSVNIPTSVSSVGQGAFARCSSLASIHIPNSVSYIDEWPFYDCLRLHKACVPNNTKTYNRGLDTFSPQTAILRPRLNPIASLQKKPACRASKASYSVYL